MADGDQIGGVVDEETQRNAAVSSCVVLLAILGSDENQSLMQELSEAVKTNAIDDAKGDADSDKPHTIFDQELHKRIESVLEKAKNDPKLARMLGQAAEKAIRDREVSTQVRARTNTREENQKLREQLKLKDQEIEKMRKDAIDDHLNYEASQREEIDAPEFMINLLEKPVATAETGLIIAGLGAAAVTKGASLGLSILGLLMLVAHDYYEVKREKYPAPSKFLFDIYKNATVGVLKFYQKASKLDKVNPVRTRICVFLTLLAFEIIGSLEYTMAKEKVPSADKNAGAIKSGDAARENAVQKTWGEKVKDIPRKAKKSVANLTQKFRDRSGFDKKSKTARSVGKTLNPTANQQDEQENEALLAKYGYSGNKIVVKQQFYDYWRFDSLLIPLKKVAKLAAADANLFYGKELTVKDHEIGPRSSTRRYLLDHTKQRLDSMMACANACRDIYNRYKEFLKGEGWIDQEDISYSKSIGIRLTNNNIETYDEWDAFWAFLEGLGDKNSPVKNAKEAFEYKIDDESGTEIFPLAEAPHIEFVHVEQKCFGGWRQKLGLATTEPESGEI